MKRIVLLLTALALLLAGCSPAPKEYRSDFFAMDTVMFITAYGDGAEEAVAAAEHSVNELEAVISRTRASSELSKLNAHHGTWFGISKEFYDILSVVKQSNFTDSFDITIAPVIDLWGIGSVSSKMPLQHEIDDILQRVSPDNIEIREDNSEYQAKLLNDAQIDLGGIGKGAAADRCAAILREQGIQSALISLGGNIYTIGQKPNGDSWSVGIADPDNSTAYIATLRADDTSVVTTGDYQRYFEQDGVRYHHIFDPKTGKPARSGLRSVTVVNDNSAYADLCATALYVLGLEDGLAACEARGIDAVFITEEKEVYITPGLTDSFTFEGEEAGYVFCP